LRVTAVRFLRYSAGFEAASLAWELLLLQKKELRTDVRSSIPRCVPCRQPRADRGIDCQPAADEGFSFWDFLDVINPLQHIPVVNTIYREMTGDEIKAPAKLIGSAILGGPVGLAAAMVDTAIEDSTGKDLGGHAMAFLRGEDAPAETQQQPVQTAAAAVSSASTAREFIPAALIAAQMTAAAPLLEDDEERADDIETARQTQETEASIAAAAAAAPQGMVFMPLKRNAAPGFKKLDTAAADTRFMPIDRTRRRTPGSDPSANAALAAAAARMQRPDAATAMMGGSRLDPMLEATKPQQDTGMMPAADPFAAARRIAEEGGAVAVPAWFDKAMMDAVGKYRATQAAGDRPGS